MSAVEGAVFRKDRWVVQLDLGKDPVTGKRRRPQMTAPPCDRHERAEEACRGCQQAARDLRATKLVELKGNTYVEPSEVTVAQWCELFLEAHAGRRRKSTIRGYRSKLKSHIVPRIGHVKVQALTGPLLEGFYARLFQGDEVRPQGYALASVRQTHALLHRALKDACRPRGTLLLTNPADGLELPGDDDGDEDVVKILRTWTAPQLRTYLDTHRDHPDWPFFWIAAVTGMRRSEVCGLRWDMVDLDRGTLRVERARHWIEGEEVWSKPKSKRSRRTIDLSAQQCATLRELKTEQTKDRLKAGPAWDDNDLVICDEVGRGPRPDRVSQTFLRLVREIEGLPEIRLHDLRHTHATLLLEAGRPVKEVSERLGHSSTAFTMDTYMHVTGSMKTETASVVDDMLGGGL